MIELSKQWKKGFGQSEAGKTLNEIYFILQNLVIDGQQPPKLIHTQIMRIMNNPNLINDYNSRNLQDFIDYLNDRVTYLKSKDENARAKGEKISEYDVPLDQVVSMVPNVNLNRVIDAEMRITGTPQRRRLPAPPAIAAPERGDRSRSRGRQKTTAPARKASSAKGDPVRTPSAPPPAPPSAPPPAPPSAPPPAPPSAPPPAPPSAPPASGPVSDKRGELGDEDYEGDPEVSSPPVVSAQPKLSAPSVPAPGPDRDERVLDNELDYVDKFASTEEYDCHERQYKICTAPCSWDKKLGCYLDELELDDI